MSVKTTALTALGEAPELTDLVHVVSGPGETTPLSRKVTLANFFEAIDRFKSLAPVTGSAANFASTFTGANLYGGTYICNAAGTIQLPLMVAGMNFTIITLGAIAVVIDTNAADGYLMDGVTGVEGSQLTNGSEAGDMAVIQSYTTDDWLIATNGWTAG